MWKDQKLEGYPGFKLRNALKGEPWTLVAGIPRERVAQERRIQDMLDVLDQKYGKDRKQQKIAYLQSRKG